MNCSLCRDLLQRQCDGETIDAVAVDGHLAGCPHCRAFEAAGKRLLAGVRLLAAPQPPATLTDRIVACVLADRRSVRRRRVFTTLALAASLLVAFGVSVLWPRPRTGLDPTREVVLRSEPIETPVDLRASLSQAGSAVVALTARTTDEAVEP